jgi:hypothetical protein
MTVYVQCKTIEFRTNWWSASSAKQKMKGRPLKEMGNDVNKPIKFRIFYEDGWEERQARKVGPDIQQQQQKPQLRRDDSSSGTSLLHWLFLLLPEPNPSDCAFFLTLPASIRIRD